MFSTTTCNTTRVAVYGQDGYSFLSVSTSEFGDSFNVMNDTAFQYNIDYPGYAPLQTVCSTHYATSSETPLVVRDDGSLVFGLGIVIFLMCLSVFGLIFPGRRK